MCKQCLLNFTGNCIVLTGFVTLDESLHLLMLRTVHIAQWWLPSDKQSFGRKIFAGKISGGPTLKG
jgi:hypothetical protein